MCLDVLMDMNVYIKFTGLDHMEEVMDYTMENLMCKINHEEHPVVDHDAGRKGVWKLIRSSDMTKGRKPGPKDLLKMRINLT